MILKLKLLTFNYLGVFFNFNGKFYQTQKHVADQGMKALFVVKCKLKKFVFNGVTMCSTFDIYINSVLSYRCEIWGFHKAPDIEKVHLNYCTRVLGVRRSTNNFIFIVNLVDYHYL